MSAVQIAMIAELPYTKGANAEGGESENAVAVHLDLQESSCLRKCDARSTSCRGILNKRYAMP